MGETVCIFGFMEMKSSEREKIGVAILAGGRSSRMGMAKSEIVIPGDGRTLLDRICDEMSFFDCRYLSLRKDQTVRRHDYKRVDDMIEDIGPLGAICSLLSVSEAGALLVLACDMPGYMKEHALRMAQHYKGEDILIPRTPGGFEPLAAVYGRSILPLIRRRIGENRYKLTSLLELTDKVTVIDEKDPEPFRNINSRSDLFSDNLNDLKKP